MAEDKNSKTNWIPTIISIIVGIVITVGATFYTIYLNKQEAAEAENERLEKVKENLVSIIEEHIVNKDSINLDGFNRLINNRVREESLYKRPSIYELLTQAEYNIQSSKHLSFDKKLDYSRILSSLYKYIITDTIINLSNNRFPEETTLILSVIDETKKNEGRKALSALIEQYEEEIISLNKTQIKEDFTLEYLFKSPSKLIFIMIGYFIMAVLVWYYLRLKRRKRALYERFSENSRYEEEKIKDEIESLSTLMKSKGISKEERTFFEERIEHLFNKLEDVGRTYYRQQKI